MIITFVNKSALLCVFRCLSAFALNMLDNQWVKRCSLQIVSFLLLSLCITACVSLQRQKQPAAFQRDKHGEKNRFYKQISNAIALMRHFTRIIADTVISDYENDKCGKKKLASAQPNEQFTLAPAWQQRLRFTDSPMKRCWLIFCNSSSGCNSNDRLVPINALALISNHFYSGGSFTGTGDMMWTL